MTPQSHKLNLPRIGCLYFDVLFSLPEGDRAVALIAECLEEGAAVATYRRGGTEHAVLFGHRTASDGTSEYRSSWFLLDPEVPRIESQGDAWTALDRGYDAIDHVHMHCMFQLTQHEPRMTLPITLFASEGFAFNQIRGYRAALVEEERTIWNATVDWIESRDGFELSVNFDEYHVTSDISSRDLFGACTAVRDSLVVERGSD